MSIQKIVPCHNRPECIYIHYVKGLVLCKIALSGEFWISQGTGQGRIVFPFMCTVYINSLLKDLSYHCFAISINASQMPAPYFADDICLIALHQSLLKILMHKCHSYSKTWRYEKMVLPLLVRLSSYNERTCVGSR